MSKISQVQSAKQLQTLKLSQSMNIMLKVLQFSNLELIEFIEKQINDNPLLEKDEANDNFYDNIKYSSDKDFDFTTIYLHEKTLNEHICEQIELSFTDKNELKTAFELADMLDSRGYLKLDEGYSAHNLENIIKKLQTFDPSGIFARDLNECLRLQLEDKGIFSDLYEKMLNNLNLVAKNDVGSLSKILGVDVNKISSMIKEIKLLNPKPASQFEKDPSIFIGPDIFVKKTEDGEYKVELNTSILPKILVDKKYYSLIKANTNDSKLILEYYNNATSIIKAIEQRAENILKIATYIIQNQTNFLEFGNIYLKPMTLKTIAEQIGVHESTVSRICANKYMHTPRGILAFKDFFSKSVNFDENSKNASNKAIMNLINEIIKNETPDNILSDDDIVELLKKRNISIARRTVAKYRGLLNIPSSHIRARKI